MLQKERLVCDTLIDMMREKPFADIRATELASRAGIARSSFYLYFGSVQDALDRIEGEIFDSLASMVETRVDASEAVPYAQRHAGLSAVSMQFLLVHAQAISVLMGPNGDPTFEAKLSRHMREMLTSVAPSAFPQATAIQQRFWVEYMLGASIYTVRCFIKECDSLSETELQELLDFSIKLNGSAKR